VLKSFACFLHWPILFLSFEDSLYKENLYILSDAGFANISPQSDF
jgi:hypothetical protein